MTYDNDHIVTLSRAWTGHALQDQRGNIENSDGGANGGRNYVDPMRLMPHWRDPFPKYGLHDVRARQTNRRCRRTRCREK